MTQNADKLPNASSNPQLLQYKLMQQINHLSQNNFNFQADSNLQFQGDITDNYVFDVGHEF